MRILIPAMLVLMVAALLSSCGGGGGSGGVQLPIVPTPDPLLVNSLADMTDPPDGTVTLRSALAAAEADQAITFDESLDGGTIALSIIADEHTVLKGEVMGIKDEPSGPVSYLVGWFDRDYGASALYAVKKVVIDASSLPSGITIAWTGGDANPARVLAVYGDLHMTNVTVTGGISNAVDIKTGNPDDQPWTLGRGGGIAVWGRARLKDCRFHDNHCVGDFESSRDRGAFGGGVYADIVEIEDCVISGNTVAGGGAAGGGVFSVTGASFAYDIDSTIERTSITGNRISGVFAYGAGVYSDGGGIGNSNELVLRNCTIARNLVEPGALPPFLLGVGYWRGGGAYISNGSMTIQSCTIVENEVYGTPRPLALGKKNLAGGVAATIGNAHAVEYIRIGHSIVAGNTVTELSSFGAPGDTYAHDIFTGSLTHFRSMGHNLIGVLDMSQLLVAVSLEQWKSLTRRHYPMVGDTDGVQVEDVLNLTSGIGTATDILSRGTDDQGQAVLHYQPAGVALDQIPTGNYTVDELLSEVHLAPFTTDDFLEILLSRIEAEYGLATNWSETFIADFEDYLANADTDEDEPGNQPHQDPDGDPIYTIEDTDFFGPPVTWPKMIANYPYITFWHRLDEALAAEAIPGMGPELLGDQAWMDLFDEGPLTENPGLRMVADFRRLVIFPSGEDQLGNDRPRGLMGDVGAIEGP